MRVQTGSNLSKVKKENFTSILSIIYQRGPITRREIASRLNVTLPTVTTTVKQLLEDGILKEVEIQEAEISLGRKAMAVNIAEKNSYVIGVEWGPFGVISCITDLRGTVVARKRGRPGEIRESYERIVEITAGYVEELLRQSGISKTQVAGAGWITPGMVDPDRGVLVKSSMDRVTWNGKHVKEDLERCLGIPVWTENHVKARAIGQDMFQRKKRPGVYLYYFAQAGISCCVMVDGEPFGKGKSGTGDIGHTIMDVDGPECICGRRGCLQSFAGEMSLIGAARKLLAGGKAARLQELCKDPNALSMEEIVQAIDCGDEDLKEAMLPAVRYMGISIANIVNLLNSELVVIDSSLMNSPALREYLDRIIAENNIFMEDLEVSTEYIDANRYTGAQGACAVAIKEFFIRREPFAG